MLFFAYSINPEMENIGIGTAAIIALLGYVVVFVGLVLLMAVIYAMGKIMVSRRKAAAPAAPVAAELNAAPKAAAAPGTAGEVKLYSVSDRDAALIMAIVANKLQKPLNELRFKSIKEVSQ